VKNKKVIIHAAASPVGMEIGSAEIRRWYVDERELWNGLRTTLQPRRVPRLGRRHEPASCHYARRAPVSAWPRAWQGQDVRAQH